jgi:hypothetical protein
VAIEGDKKIFKSLLDSLIVEPVVEVSKKQRLHEGSSTVDEGVEDLSIPKIVPCNKYCK